MPRSLAAYTFRPFRPVGARMRLKRLELFGFKSFADRTAIEFPGGLTGIIGPNGCGKSNVVDAVRWALGETRPTSMRGGEMTDVIFKGSTSRPSMGLAEVTLVLDNAEGVLPTHGAEVSVTRRVHKDGQGEYEIDGARVRLKDVKDLLFDTGLGSRGYSVLEQGKIDAVLSANALERRTIFEEAAGVSRYRQRRKETESRLKRVDADTERLDDLIGELQTRVRSLKIQAGKAERWIAARDEWRVKGTRLARVAIEGEERTLAELRAELGELETKTAELRRARSEAEGEVREREAAQEALHAKVDELSQRAAELVGDLRAIDERAAALRRRATQQTEAVAGEEQRIAELEVRLTDRRTMLTDLETELARLAGEHERAEASAAETADTFQGAVRRYREARGRSEDQARTTTELLHEKTAAFHRKQSLDAAREPLAARVSQAADQRVEAEGRAEAVGAERTERRAALERAQERLAAAEREAERREAELAESGRRCEDLADERRGLEVERAALESRAAALVDWEREREGLGEGARRLLEAARNGHEAGDGLADLARSVDGVLADHAVVEARFAAALDAALEDDAQALVLRDEERLEDLADWLEREEQGRVRVVCATPGGGVAGFATFGLERFHPPMGYESRVHGLLLDRVRMPVELARPVRRRLARTVLVEDLATARELARRFDDWCFVSLRGERFEAGVACFGGRARVAGPIARRVEAAELRAEAERAGAALVALAARLVDAEHAHERSTHLRRQAAAACEAARAEAAAASVEERAASEREQDARRELERAAEAEAAALAERRELDGRIQDALRAHEELERRFALENGRLEELESARTDRERERDDAGREEARARIEANRVTESLRALERRRADLGQACADAAEEIELANQRTASAREDARVGLEQADALDTQRVEVDAQREGVETQLASSREQEREGRVTIEALRRRAEQVTAELEGGLGRLSELELARQRSELHLDEVLRRLAEDFELDRERLFELVDAEPELAEDAAREALEGEVAELKRQLDRLGPVNLEAVEELEEVEQRFGFMSEQRADLAEARAELLRTLDTINTESERLFLETFEEVRANFRAIFRLLFGGGKADCTLEPDKPVLEAGIEISARPPGRETLPIGLLSGGQRTMTALALLFAVFEARPSPFCILDEVDAALDDANVARFLGMLDTFLEKSQFIVVTHNKGTMSACDLLHGVTMETKGVSKVVSVELGEVDDFVPEAFGDAAKVAEATREALAEAERERAEFAEARREAAEVHSAEDTSDVEEDGEPIVELVPEPAPARAAEAVEEPDAEHVPSPEPVA